MTGIRDVSAAAAAGTLLLGGCATVETPGTDAEPSSIPSPAATRAPDPAPATEPSVPPSTEPASRPGPQAGDGAPAEGTLAIPALGITDLRVVPYRGVTDDAPGTVIQDDGAAASPHGPGGGVGPGGVGNYQVTAHRLSSTRAFEFLPDLGRGDRVSVVADGVRWTYQIRGTRRTSFRDPASLRAQRAAVPGRPGARPTRAMITLSTCATPEDRAVGNYWSDEFGNPEHRIDKIGVLVTRSPA